MDPQLQSSDHRSLISWVVMLVFYPLYFFLRTRLDYLNSGFSLLLELCNPYLTVFTNMTMLSTSTNLPINFYTKLSRKSVKIRN